MDGICGKCREVWRLINLPIPLSSLLYILPLLPAPNTTTHLLLPLLLPPLLPNPPCYRMACRPLSVALSRPINEGIKQPIKTAASAH